MPRPDRAARAALLALALATEPVAAQVQDAGQASDRLESVEADLATATAEAERLRREADALAERLLAATRAMVAAAAEVQRQEAQVQAIETRLAELTAQEETKAAEQEARRAELAATISALARLALRPPDALIAMPVSVTEIYHTGRLMAALVPAIEGRARELSADVAALQALRDEVLAQQAALGPAIAALEAKQADLAAQVSETARLRGEALGNQEEAASRAAALAEEAASLRDLIDSLADAATAEPAVAALTGSEAEPALEDGADFAATPPVPAAKPLRIVVASAAPAEAVPVEPVEAESVAEPAAQSADGAAGTAPEADGEAEAEAAAQAAAALPAAGGAPGSFAEAKGRLPFPAAGRIEVRFGQPRSDGSLSQGLVLDTREGAQVITPYDGEVVYAGPFRDYGQLLIIAHGGGYHSVLAGFAKIDATVGQWVLAGEPVGVVGSGPGGKATLYVEFRHDGQPIDPMPWLTLDEGNG